VQPVLVSFQACAIGGGLLRLVGLILFFVFFKLAGTERARYRLWAKQNYEFGTNVANHTMVLLLGLSFTVLAPLIAPFCLLYFSLALLAQKYQLIYVVTLPYQAAGRMWMNVSGCAPASVLLDDLLGTHPCMPAADCCVFNTEC
jgi:formate hydrogenlyase subunit 3/multisubunit Na+/H+ antiporter MnhD subunit